MAKKLHARKDWRSICRTWLMSVAAAVRGSDASVSVAYFIFFASGSVASD